MKKSRETDSVQGHSDVSIDRARRKEERDPLLSPRLHCYPTVAPAGGQESVRLGLSCTETDAQACVNDSLSPRMSAGCRSACYSLQVLTTSPAQWLLVQVSCLLPWWLLTLAAIIAETPRGASLGLGH
ncbi:putative capsid protein [Dissostichus eleginoides]|uniref:Capsid protein n=1 Tax=Dissostichus eleginoides TaxID=100907 RepID=A0AAD9BQN3_DISEL|nr:putative capsid protein [Dissostichus eleginoides]